MIRPHITLCAVALTILTGMGLEPSVADAQQGSGADGAPPRPAAASAIDYGTAHLDRRLQAVRATGPITLDGALNEPAWSAAPVANNFLQNDPREGEPATFDTDVRILYDADALYFGVFARDDEPGNHRQ